MLGLLVWWIAADVGDDGGRRSGFWRIAAVFLDAEPRTAGDPKSVLAGDRRAPNAP